MCDQRLFRVELLPVRYEISWIDFKSISLFYWCILSKLRDMIVFKFSIKTLHFSNIGELNNHVILSFDDSMYTWEWFKEIPNVFDSEIPQNILITVLDYNQVFDIGSHQIFVSWRRWRGLFVGWSVFFFRGRPVKMLQLVDFGIV